MADSEGKPSWRETLLHTKFSAIATPEEAEKRILDCAKAFFLLALIQGILGFFFFKPAIIDAIICAVLALFLRSFFSRAAAVALLVYALLAFVQTLKNKLGAGAGGTNLLMAVVVVGAAASAVHATFVRARLMASLANSEDAVSAIVQARSRGRGKVVAWVAGVLLVLASLPVIGVEYAYHRLLAQAPVELDDAMRVKVPPILASTIWAAEGERGVPRMEPVHSWRVAWSITAVIVHDRLRMGRYSDWRPGYQAGFAVAHDLQRGIYFHGPQASSPLRRRNLVHWARAMWISRHCTVEQVLETLAGGEVRWRYGEDLPTAFRRAWGTDPAAMTPVQAVWFWLPIRYGGRGDYKDWCRWAEALLSKLRDNGAITSQQYTLAVIDPPSRRDYSRISSLVPKPAK